MAGLKTRRRDLQPRKGSGLVGHPLHTARHAVGDLELEGVGDIAHVEVHALERGQRHFLHFKGLNGGFQGGGVLVQPELHRLEFVNAPVELFYIERRRDPVAKVGQLRNFLRGTARRLGGQVLQEVETGHKLAKTGK